MPKAAQISNAAATSTGNYPSTSAVPAGNVSLGAAVQNVSVAVVHDSTKQVAWKLQGDIAGAGAWKDLTAATSSTGSSIVNSTVAGVYTNFRVNVTANGSTGNVTTRWYLIGA